MYTVERLVELLKKAPGGYMTRKELEDAGIGRGSIPALLKEAEAEGRSVLTRAGGGNVIRLSDPTGE